MAISINLYTTNAKNEWRAFFYVDKTKQTARVNLIILLRFYVETNPACNNVTKYRFAATRPAYLRQLQR